jgi:hypothetical protein
MLNLTTADISDSAGVQVILDAIRKRWLWVKYLLADDAYDSLQLMDKASNLEFALDIIRRHDGQKAFEGLPRSWVVERTFGWMIRCRRLVREYERRIDVSTAMIHVAMGGVLIRRDAHPRLSQQAPKWPAERPLEVFRNAAPGPMFAVGWMQP